MAKVGLAWALRRLDRTVGAGVLSDGRPDVSHRHRSTDRVDEMTRPGDERGQQVGLVEREQKFLRLMIGHSATKRTDRSVRRTTRSAVLPSTRQSSAFSPCTAVTISEASTSCATALSTSSGRPTLSRTASLKRCVFNDWLSSPSKPSARSAAGFDDRVGGRVQIAQERLSLRVLDSVRQHDLGLRRDASE